MKSVDRSGTSNVEIDDARGRLEQAVELHQMEPHASRCSRLPSANILLLKGLRRARSVYVPKSNGIQGALDSFPFNIPFPVPRNMSWPPTHISFQFCRMMSKPWNAQSVAMRGLCAFSSVIEMVDEKPGFLNCPAHHFLPKQRGVV